MKYLFLITFVFFGLGLKSQTPGGTIEGTVSYLTTKSIYVKFKSTENIAIGDTLYFRTGERLLPALIVKNLSSVSCVSIPISTIKLSVNDSVVAKQKQKDARREEKIALKAMSDTIVVIEKDTLEEKSKKTRYKQDFSGSLSVASYSNLSNSAAGNSQRMRYTFLLYGKHLGNTRFSADSYISFRHKQDEWNEIKDNLNKALKIYSLSLKYDFDKNSYISVGRKINSKISNIGAIDGFQAEKSIRNFTIGAIAGSRPDISDYSFNPNLIQFGTYGAHNLKTKNGTMQNSLAFIEQKNNTKTDRRLAYFQHSNSLVKNLYLFYTFEMELYKVVNNLPVNSLNFSSLYVSLRYKVLKQLTLSASYDARKNIIYYESYKSYLDQVINFEIRQGYRFQIAYRPLPYLSMGIKAGYRFQKKDTKPSINLYSYVRYSNIPVLQISTTLSTTVIQSNYLNGKIYNLAISRDLIPGKIYAVINYKYIDYRFFNYEQPLIQNIADFNISWRIYKKLSVSLYYEGSFEKQNNNTRLYMQIRQRF